MPHVRNPKQRRDAFRPSDEEQLLLRASLLPVDRALPAWEQWRASVDIEEIVSETVTILPMLYKNLHQHVQHKLINIAKGVYRRSWYLNQTLFVEAAENLKLLEENGIQTLVLKGAALAELYYQDLGLRRMADVDILIPYERAEAAMDLLESRGWAMPHYAPLPRERLMQIKHGEEFRNQAGKAVDIHWNIFYASRQQELDQECWARAQQFDFRGVPTLVLCPSDQLLHVLVHGISFKPRNQFRWVADALTLLRAVEIDWDIFYQQAIRRRLCLQAHDTLSYIVDEFEAEVPSSLMQKLSQGPESDRDYVLYNFYSWPTEPQPYLDQALQQPKFLRALTLLWRRYMISLWTFQTEDRVRQMSALEKIVGLLSFTRIRLGLGSLWQLPAGIWDVARRNQWHRQLFRRKHRQTQRASVP